MSVTTKFKVDSFERTICGKETFETIKMSPVFKSDDPDTEYSKLWRWTPSGSLQLDCLNPAASQYFELGKEYFLEFTKAP